MYQFELLQNYNVFLKEYHNMHQNIYDLDILLNNFYHLDYKTIINLNQYCY